ncbi:MAG: acyl carrier protein [Gammaproteobacteria bacterium]
MNRQHVLDLIVQHAREVVPFLEAHAFTPTDSLRELGANSIDRSEILLMTMEALNLRIPLVQLAPAKNIGELADLICQKGAQVA